MEKVSNSELLAMFGGGGGNALPAGFHDPSVAKLHPKVCKERMREDRGRGSMKGW